MEPQLEQQQEDWSPKTDEWFECSFDYRLSKDILVGKFENGERVWIHTRDVKAPGQHVCFAYGTPMCVRMEFNLPNQKRISSNKKYQYRALQCVVEGEFPEKMETGIVESWVGTAYGVARRPCGCTLFVKTPGPDVVFKEGSAIKFNTVWSKFKKTYIGLAQMNEDAGLAAEDRGVKNG